MNEEQLEKTISRLKTSFSDNRAPIQPVFGMRWIQPKTGVEHCYVPPGFWKPVKGESVGSWTINPAITDPAVTSTLNDLKDLLLLAGIIN